MSATTDLRVFKDMTNRFLFLMAVVLLGVLPVGLMAAEAVDQVSEQLDELKLGAENALLNGDLEGALDKYLVIYELDSTDTVTLDRVTSLALELGLTDLAVEMWVRSVDVAVVSGNKSLVVQNNAEITTIFRRQPAWVAAQLTKALEYSSDQEDLALALQEMSAEAQAALVAGDAEGALAAQEGALFVATESFGDQHWFTISANRDLGFIYRQLGVADQAEQYYSIALAGAEQQLGPEHPASLQITEYIAELYSALGLQEEASLVAAGVIEGYVASLGPYHETTINARYSKVESLKLQNDYRNASNELAVLCDTLTGGYGAYHPETIYCLKSSADLQLTLGQLADAETTYNTVIERKNLALTDVDASVLGVLSQLAEIYRLSGRYQESTDLLSSVVHTALQMGEIEASYAAKSYLGRVLNNLGEYEKAQLVMQETLQYGLLHWLATPGNIYNLLLELGAVYQAQGKFLEAEASFAEALEGLVEVYGENHPSALVASNNLGTLYEKSGFYDKAEPLIKKTLTMMEQTLGEDHPNTLNTRNNLGLIHESQGNFREAEPLYLKSLAKMITVRGETSSDTIAVKNNLAYLYMLMQDYERSAKLFTEVQQQWLTLFGEKHQNSLKATNNLGRVYQKLGRLVEAEQLIVTALNLRQSVLGEAHIDAIRSMIDLGGIYIEQGRLDEAEALLKSALSLAEKQLGELHPYTFEALNALAQAQENKNQLQAAVELREVGFIRRSRFLDTMLWTTGDNAREGYIRLHRGEFNSYLSLLARIGDAASAKRLVNASLQRKGLLLKVTSEIQQIATMTRDPELRSLAVALETARKDLAAKTLSGPTAETQGRHTEVLYELEQTVNELQGELGRASVRFRTSIARINADSLQAVIPEGTALVDFMTFESAGDNKLLAAVVTKHNGNVSYEFIQYTDREAIDEIVVEYRTIIQDDEADEDDLLDTGIAAYEEVWGPLSDLLEGIEHVYLIPDGILNILPFNALIDADEQYLIQTTDLQILTSGRDLLPSEYRLAEGEYLILAGPDYDSTGVVSQAEMEVAKGKRSAALQLGIRGAGGGLRGLSFLPLPGAAQEGRIIVDAVSRQDTTSTDYFGAEAQEQVLGAMTTPPEILHIATHGFFLKADDTLRKRILKAQRSAEIHVPPPGDNPLLRAGLAFAGINTNAQFLGDIETSNDGVLTALEVLDLNLSGTRLVILSACETGLGEIHEGEGVYGLRRSFQEAGVAEVISSLWEVSDAGTQALMTDFYQQLLAGTPAREALRQVQLELIDSPEWGYPYIWSAFMIVGSYESAGFNVQ
ncbi:MAG: CHAT domain-containing protein [Pseudomonadales bacterium]|nr:CHAT domain-containing protein [Pseudomonadales bacterium]